MGQEPQREILNIEEAATFLGVSVKTFNKVLHSQSLPARKIGREWKFSRQALVAWVGSGISNDFYRESTPASENGARVPAPRKVESGGRTRRTDGWRIEFD